MQLIEYFMIFCTLWLASGFLIFIVGTFVDKIKNIKYDDHDWLLGLFICLGAGPIILWYLFEEYIEERKSKRRRTFN